MHRLCLLILAFCSLISVRAETLDSAEKDQPSPAQMSSVSDSTHYAGDTPTVNSYDILETNNRDPRMLLLEGEQAQRAGNWELAMSKVKKCLALENDDMDAHCLYANLLQEQLEAQTERDPSLYNRCVEE